MSDNDNDLFRCPYCSGDALAPDHELRCCGRQGKLEATTITRPRATSVEAFYAAIARGTIRTRRLQIWIALQAIQLRTGLAATCGEIFEYLKEEQRVPLRYDSNTATRLTELRDMGLIREVGERPCRVTGQTCITWEVVPAAEYAGVVTVHRCPTCRQIVSRDIPTKGPTL
jgi:DNA-directed RNA polymerase subunit RPC12/RpoP